MAADWIVVPCLLALRAEFDRLAPHRDKGADGTIGDPAHQQESSDHNPDETGRTPYSDADHVNEVHGLDIDATGPWPVGRSLDDCVEIIRLRHLRGHDARLQNIVWRDRVASRSWGWTWEARPGIGHLDHAHFSAVYTSAQEADTRAWGLIEEDDMDWTDDVITNPSWRADAKTNPTVQAKFAIYAAWNEAHAANVALASVAAQLKALTGKDFTDEQAIVTGVLAGLDPAAIAAAIPADLAGQVADELAARLAG
ncbi:MAG: hypothetical protein ABW046_20660 [Actinoplanes sp.]